MPSLIRKSIFTIIFSVSVLVLHAQSYFGLHAGAAMTHFNIKEEQESYTGDWVPGVNSGLHFDFGINKRLAIQAGMDIYQKGFVRWNRYKYRITYLDWSVLVKFKAYDIKYNEKGKRFGIYGLIGPYAGKGLYGRLKDKKKGSSEKHEPVSGQRQNFGLLAGAGVMFPMKNGHYFVDLNYNYCVSDVDESGEGHAYRGLLARFGYAWKL